MSTEFLSEADLVEIDRPDLETVVPRAGDPVNEAFRRLGAVIAIVSILVIWALLLSAVAMRYLAGSSTDFATELPAYLYPWMITGGVVVAMALGGHIAVDFVLSRLRTRAQQRAQTAVWVFSGLLFTLVCLLSLRLIEPLLAQITPILGWPQLGSFAAFITMSTCLALQSFARAWFISRRPGAGDQQEVYGA